MNAMWKRVISLMLCLVLAVGCLPISALAAEEDPDYLFLATDRHADTSIIGTLINKMESVIGENELDYLGLGGNSDQEKLENLITAINELKARVGIKATIRDYGVDEADFLNRLDDMVEQAFDDQCTGANPRYPLMSEIRQMYLNAYYGKHFEEKEMPTVDQLDETNVKIMTRKGNN